MEVIRNSSGDFSPEKHRIGNLRRSFNGNLPLLSHPSDSFTLANFLAGGGVGGGLLSTPPVSLSHSFPPSVSVLRQQSLHRSQQPPLLPLPVSFPPISRSNSNCNHNNRLSSPPINKKIKNRGRDHSLTPKKSKNPKKDLKKDEDVLPPPPEKKEPAPLEKCLTVETTDRMGPDPKDLPTVVVSKVLSSSINEASNVSCVDRFSGSVMFTPSPPPSSLPLPTFSLRPKLSCNAQAAAGIDAGATDGLRRLLRLR